MDLTEIGLRAVGAFYVFAGYVATRAALTSHLIDVAISAIANKRPAPVERALTWWFLLSATLVLAGGLALFLLLGLAPYLFLVSAAGQFAYLNFLAPRYFDREDPPDPMGRARTKNAFVIYLFATAFVLWASYLGRLVSLADVQWPAWVVLGGLVGAHLVYVFWTLRDRPLSRPAGTDEE